MRGKIDIYTEWKRSTVEEINEMLTSVATKLIEELMSHVPGASYSELAEVASALQQLAPCPARGPQYEVTQQAKDDIRATLDDYETNTGLRLEGGGVSYRIRGDHEYIGLAVGMSCDPWRAAVEECVGHPVTIEIVIRCLEEEGVVEAELSGSCYLEHIDLLAYKAAADAYWTDPRAWASMRTDL